MFGVFDLSLTTTETDMEEDKEACIFCRINTGEAEVSIIHEDELCLAFMDIQPAMTEVFHMNLHLFQDIKTTDSGLSPAAIPGTDPVP